MYFYVYKITNTEPLDERKFYIGVRTSKVEPLLDIKYWGSSKSLSREIRERGISIFRKEILSIFNDRSAAVEEEIRLHMLYNVDKNLEYYNLSISGSIEYDASDRVSVFDSEGKTLSVSTKDPKYLSGNYKSITHGFVTCRNDKGENVRVKKDDFYSNEKYTSPNVGMVPAKDFNGNTFLANKNDPRLLNGEIMSVHKGKVMCTDQCGKNRLVTSDEFKNDPNLFGVCKNKISGNKNGRAKIIDIFNNSGDLIYRCDGNFKKVCMENKFPFVPLKKSHINGGVPIYQSKKAKTDSIKNGTQSYIGWYAKEIK